MRRIGFRRLLPALFTLVHLLLIFSTMGNQPYPTAIAPSATYHRTSFQEGGGIPTEPIEHRPLAAVHKAALLLSLPAMFPAVLIAEVFFPPSDTAWMYTCIPFVALLWFVIGRWLDGMMGYADRLRLIKPLRSTLEISSMFVLFIGLIGLTPLYHHRTHDTYLIFTGLSLWSGLCLAIARSSRALKQNRS